MNNLQSFAKTSLTAFVFASFLSATSCKKDPTPDDANGAAAVLLVIDEESIDNGNAPNNFSSLEVNDQLAETGLRLPLKYFQDNVGDTIELYTGEMGDEGWFALKTIPSTWKTTGPSANGSRNFLSPGPGLGATIPNKDKDVYLENVPDVTPLRATGLAMLTGQTVLAVVYDSDVSINYSPLKGNLKGSNLGVVAFKVIRVTQRFDGSSSSLPRVTIRILNTTDVAALPLTQFSNAPVPQSSSEVFDVAPPASIPAIVTVAAQ